MFAPLDWEVEWDGSHQCKAISALIVGKPACVHLSRAESSCPDLLSVPCISQEEKEGISPKQDSRDGDAQTVAQSTCSPGQGPTHKELFLTHPS